MRGTMREKGLAFCLSSTTGVSLESRPVEGLFKRSSLDALSPLEVVLWPEDYMGVFYAAGPREERCATGGTAGKFGQAWRGEP